ncbi:hypothetical protein [Nostoc sp. DedQUE09]|nr:hypothetical protein [Nostoc sp. DedQUE09]MDZ7953780.1 hypothetical protein [Nostoc sp. DedQUE09]
MLIAQSPEKTGFLLSTQHSALSYSRKCLTEKALLNLSQQRLILSIQ